MRRYVTWRDGLCAGVLGALIVSTSWFTVNLSASIPLGLYRYVRTADAFQRGDILRLPAVDFGRSWWASWLALLKPVAGLPGDEACITPDGLWVTEITHRVDGTEARRTVPYGEVHQQHRDTPLPVFWGCHVVEDGAVFVASHEPKSLDSRYFGPVQAEQALRAVPLWTWR